MTGKRLLVFLGSAGALLVGVALIFALLRSQDIDLVHLAGLFGRLGKAAFAGVLVTTFLHVWLGAVKWRILSRHFHESDAPRSGYFFFHTALQNLVGHFVPPPLAIVAGRAAVMRLRQDVSLKGGFGNALYDQGFDYLVPLLLIPASLAQLWLGFGFGVWGAISLVLVALAGVVLGRWGDGLMRGGGLILRRFPLASRWAVYPEQWQTRRILQTSLVWKMMGLSAARTVLLVLRLVCGALALPTVVPWDAVAYAMPLAGLVAMAPVTPANLGIAEWSWVVLLGWWMVAPPLAVAFAVAFRVQAFLAQALVAAGGVVFYFASPLRRMAVFCLCLLCLAGCGGATGAGEDVGTRFVRLRNSDTGETVALFYARDGSYDRAALRKINEIFRDRRTGETTETDPRLVNFLVDIRRALALPAETTIDVLSGYRSPESNALLAQTNTHVARESWHMKGKAVDFRIQGMPGRASAEIAKTLQRGGVAWYPGSDHVHIDTGEVRSWAVK